MYRELVLRGGRGHGCDQLSRQRSDERGRFSPLPRLKATSVPASFHFSQPEGYVLSNMHVNWVGERGKRAERRSILWCLLTWIFFNLAA